MVFWSLYCIKITTENKFETDHVEEELPQSVEKNIKIKKIVKNLFK